MYLVKARDGYRRWGADGKVRQLEARYPRLALADPLDGTSETRTPDQQLDLAAVVKASQALSSEMLLPPLIERLMTIVMQNAGADRGLLILPHQNDYRIEAEARTDGEGIVLHYGAAAAAAVPDGVIRYVMRTHKSVILGDAAKQDLFSEDPYLNLRRPRSVLCLPLVRQGVLGGLLYLENTLASHVFAPDRATLIELLASQAAISLENATLYTDLRRSEAFLAQGQRVSQTGSFGWSVASGEFYWSEEIYNILEYNRDIQASVDLALQRMHPDDRESARLVLDAATRENKDFDSKHRLLMPDGRVKYVHTTGRAVKAGNLAFVGAVRDITDQTLSEEALRQTQSDLAHVARIATLNTMTASIAHEVSQPLSGILTNARTCVRMLGADPPNLAGAAETARRTIRDANRASEVIQRLRAMVSSKAPTMEKADLNEVAREVIALSMAELRRSGALLQTDFADDLPHVAIDRVQVQQVILNLLLNAADAMAGVEDRPRVILVQTRLQDDGSVRLDVRDSGNGVDPKAVERLFDAFYTTKPNGLGVGLSISRSIIEKHDGRLWVEANAEPGATFSFCIPRTPRNIPI
jgi:PAS domain S-box-containing protein